LTRNAARGGRRPLHVKRKTPRQGTKHRNLSGTLYCALWGHKIKKKL